ncbi:hypothetical protein [Bacteroides thetaiotaomicron]|uniref:hypothetical protein n=1 Tax=Bacteroides thetaiotaomicron TaxID=818 RepID=UPI0020044041|nr:hypothetical protein [Bacteroides thetaiotaomicron]
MGTVEKNRLIRQLAEKGKLDISSLEGHGNDSDSDGFPSIPRSQQSAGSSGERQAGSCVRTFFAFGNDGVSPWYWWADVPVKKHKTLYVDAPATLSKTPR